MPTSNAVFLLKLKLDSLKALLVKYKPVLRFVALFLGSYLLLSFCYGIYLQLSKNGAYYPDFITHLVAQQSNAIIGNFENAQILPHQTEPSMMLIVNGIFVARIIEGCNAISILILFASFIIAFAQGPKKTLIFLFAGAVIIYSVNLLRIVFLAYSLYHYPEYKEILHGVVFPGLIYGMVFLLWMLWVRMLKTETKTEHV